MPSSSRRERVVFVELWRLGDAVLATAGLRALRLARPDAEIALVSHPAYDDPLRRSGDFDRYIPFPAFWTRGLRARDRYLPWTIDYAAVARAWWALRGFRADTYLLFRGNPREQLFFSSVGGGDIVDVRRHHILPGIRVLPTPGYVHRYHDYVHHVQLWSGTTVTALPHIEGIEPAAEPKPYVLFSPGAGWEFRRWKAPKSAALAHALVDRLQSLGMHLIVVGGGGERSLLAAIQEAVGSPLDVRTPTLPELYSLVAGARAVVCNNTGTLHIAEAIGTPCAVITGPSDPVRFGVFRSHSRNVCGYSPKPLHDGTLPCHPCHEGRCLRPDHPCIDEVGVADVTEALTEMRAFAHEEAPSVI